MHNSKAVFLKNWPIGFNNCLMYSFLESNIFNSLILLSLCLIVCFKWFTDLFVTIHKVRLFLRFFTSMESEEKVCIYM